MKKLDLFSKYAWGVLVYTIGVILWGAFVRATGSGAGCGNHWPLCDGEVLPRSPGLETIIEFTHRATSGIAILLVVGLLIWGFRAYGKGHPVRIGVVLAMAFMITESLVGAALVLLGLVGDNVSIERAAVMAIHLVNTFFLLGFLTLTAWWSSGGRAMQFKGNGLAVWILVLGMVGMLVLGASGAVTALGDTLFLATPGIEGSSKDLSPTALLLLRLRIFHPTIAVVISIYVILAGWFIRRLKPQPEGVYLSHGLTWLLLLQLGLGYLNVLLYAPIWMQLVHLLMADVIWIVMVILAANVLALRKAEIEEGSRAFLTQSLLEETPPVSVKST